ncbi:hypothetical protein DFH06DRAFT_1351575 [Mycena polygramma]|nr:hypothetical protein DFH06DRAFT_1351575 [Mycena polygramma]
MEIQAPTPLWTLLRNLPPELLSAVLLFATRQGNVSALKSARRRRTLCLVCKTWADILYATPRAWSRLSVMFTAPPTAYTISTWLSNSKAARIEVSVEILHVPAVDGIAKMSAFVDLHFTLLHTHFPASPF